jgi:hypothetical protein
VVDNKEVEMIEYYTAPDSHPNNDEIVSLEDRLEDLTKEYDSLTADDVEWTQEGENRCIELEILIDEVSKEINYLNEV